MSRAVLIGTPSTDCTNSCWYSLSLFHTGQLCARSDIRLEVLFMTLDAIVQNARNDILRIAYLQNFDDLIWIDADQSWEPDWILRLLNYPVDVVGGTVRKKTDATELYNVKHRDFDIPVDPATGLLMPESLGTGFLRMSRRAIEVLWNGGEAYKVFGAEESRWVFDIRPENGELIGEDTRVSWTLRQHGIETYLDPTICCGHVGTKKWNGDFLAWLRRAQSQYGAPVTPRLPMERDDVPVAPMQRPATNEFGQGPRVRVRPNGQGHPI